jgi:hypothetical protein
MGANLALARLKTKTGCRRRPTRGLSFHLAHDRLVFNGLLFICGAFKKRKSRLRDQVGPPGTRATPSPSKPPPALARPRGRGADGGQWPIFRPLASLVAQLLAPSASAKETEAAPWLLAAGCWLVRSDSQYAVFSQQSNPSDKRNNRISHQPVAHPPSSAAHGTAAQVRLLRC